MRVEGVGKVYGELRAVSDLSFEVNAGEVVGLVGPNGAGKTTTLRCLAGIIPSTRGRIEIAGHDLLLDPVRAKGALAFLPDEPRLFDYLTVREHLNLVARIYGVAGWEPKAQVLLEELELQDKENSLPLELSRGMKQKLSIACGFLHDPRLILLDEPLTGLDPLGIRRMSSPCAAAPKRAPRSCCLRICCPWSRSCATASWSSPAERRSHSVRSTKSARS